MLNSRMKSLRTEDKFSLFYEEVQKQSNSLTEEPVLPRYRKTPKRYDAGVTPHRYQSSEDRYRHSYFEVLEVVSGVIERRFDQQDLKIIKDIEQSLINASNGEAFDISASVSIFLGDDMDIPRLKTQMLMLPDMIRTAYSNSIPIKKVTNI